MFDEPGSADQFKIKDHVGDLVLVAVNGFTPQLPTAFGIRDTIRCTIAVIDAKNDPNEQGKVYGDAMIFGSKIVPQLRGSMHRVVLGRVALGTAKPGQNAPYQLDKFSTEDAKAANDWVERNGPFEVQPVDADQAPPDYGSGHAQQQSQQAVNPLRNNGGQQQGQQQPSFAGSNQTHAASSYTNPPQTDRPPF